ncbi:hypothetical protein COEREDRAFT_82445 [Coemansia reversa NRRL 1564]|uniref:Uncharacterized protein n=1 Tax=Coemansia reversa (strain ATCC 12441 / NRRL 1564) TaxID=763665 RepID=A0A2G5B778_COERN|nr:hypothetical protein COEREDRAFT_82445 [Coemansia reversa NRRL 1564]|eukprot:PIA14832.1 hypothetical protein COEREDRAFT_82445 [Coemansia reversa NRRL 1564]
MWSFNIRYSHSRQSVKIIAVNRRFKHRPAEAQTTPAPSHFYKTLLSLGSKKSTLKVTAAIIA